MIGYALLLITYFSNGQVDTVKPVLPTVFESQYDCEKEIKFEEMKLPPLKVNQELICGEVH